MIVQADNYAEIILMIAAKPKVLKAAVALSTPNTGRAYSQMHTWMQSQFEAVFTIRVCCTLMLAGEVGALIWCIKAI